MDSSPLDAFIASLAIFYPHHLTDLDNARQDPVIVYNDHNELHTPRSTLADLVDEDKRRPNPNGNIKHKFGTELIPVGIAAKSSVTKYRHEGFEMEDAGGPRHFWALYRG